MDSLKNLEFRQPAFSAVVGIVSCVISISSLMGLKKFGLSFAVFVISSVCVFCFKKLSEHYRHRKSTPGEENHLEKSWSKILEESFPFHSFSEELLDCTEKCNIRRHSYPLQLSEKVNYTFLRLIETFDKNSPSCNENTECDNDFKEKENQNKIVCLKENTSQNSDELRVTLRKCIHDIEDSIGHLRSLTGKDISDLEQQSKDYSKFSSGAEFARPKDKGVYPSKRNVVSPCVTENPVNYTETSKDANRKTSLPSGQNEKTETHVENNNTKRFCDLRNSVSNEDIAQLHVSQIVSPGIQQDVRLTSVLHGQQLKSDLLKHEKGPQIKKISNSGEDSVASSMLGITPYEPERELKKQSRINILQHSTADSQKSTVCLQQISKCIASGIILDPSRLEKILERPEIRHFLLSPYNTTAVSSDYNSDGMFSNSSDSISFDSYLKYFVCSEDRKKQLESTHLLHSSDSALPSGSMDHGSLFPSTVDLDFSGILDERKSERKYSSGNMEPTSSSTSQKCFKRAPRGIVSDRSYGKHVQQSNSNSFSSENNKTAYGSLESFYVTEPSGFILYPLQLDKESLDSLAETKRGVDETSSGSLQHDSNAITSEVVGFEKEHPDTIPRYSGRQIVETVNRPKEKSKSSFLLRIRNSFKFGTRKKRGMKDQKVKY